MAEEKNNDNDLERDPIEWLKDQPNEDKIRGIVKMAMKGKKRIPFKDHHVPSSALIKGVYALCDEKNLERPDDINIKQDSNHVSITWEGELEERENKIGIGESKKVLEDIYKSHLGDKVTKNLSEKLEYMNLDEMERKTFYSLFENELEEEEGVRKKFEEADVEAGELIETVKESIDEIREKEIKGEELTKKEKEMKKLLKKWQMYIKDKTNIRKGEEKIAIKWLDSKKLSEEEIRKRKLTEKQKKLIESYNELVREKGLKKIPIEILEKKTGFSKSQIKKRLMELEKKIGHAPISRKDFERLEGRIVEKMEDAKVRRPLDREKLFEELPAKETIRRRLIEEMDKRRKKQEEYEKKIFESKKNQLERLRKKWINSKGRKKKKNKKKLENKLAEILLMENPEKVKTEKKTEERIKYLMELLEAKEKTSKEAMKELRRLEKAKETKEKELKNLKKREKQAKTEEEKEEIQKEIEGIKNWEKGRRKAEKEFKMTKDLERMNLPLSAKDLNKNLNIKKEIEALKKLKEKAKSEEKKKEKEKEIKKMKKYRKRMKGR